MSQAASERAQVGSQTLARGLRALLTVLESNDGVTVQQLASELEVHRTIAYRLLRTLASFGFITCGSDGAYRPGARLATLADAYLPALREAALPVMRGLADRIGCTVSLLVVEGEEAVSTISSAVADHGVRAAQVTAVGGFRAGEVGYFDRDRADYLPIPIDGQVEVLSLLGDVAELDRKPALHVHAVLGRPDGSTLGGHLLAGEVWPTLEVFITEVAPELAKRVDPETGLALISGAAAA